MTKLQNDFTVNLKSCYLKYKLKERKNVRFSNKLSNIFQVLLKASSLNSNDVFVLRTPSASFVWCGKGSTGDEREMAKNIAHSMASADYTVVYEGIILDSIQFVRLF